MYNAMLSAHRRTGISNNALFLSQTNTSCGFPGGSVVKSLPANTGHAGDMSSISGLRRSSGEDGNPLQYSCLGNPMERGAWWATVHGGHKKVGHDLATKRQEQQPGTERDAYGIWMRAAQSRFTDFLLVLRAILMWINIHCSHFVGEVTEALGDD